MNAERFKRKLIAILSADAKDYSRLMGEDEDATVRTLTEYREVMATLIQQHHGRVVDSPGDNLLAEFASVVDALRCAWDIQHEIKNRNIELAENRRMNFRIGVNLGDVIEEKERIYGDGVNIAARLESSADEGGICISGTAYDHVKNKLSFSYDYQGEQTVKNIKEPVRMYRVIMEPEAAGKGMAEKIRGPRRRRWLALVGSVILVMGTAMSLWYFWERQTVPVKEVFSEERMDLPLPDKPSIAVLPFANLSGDSEQEYFSDGITNDIITDLSKFRELFVIASNTVFTYKGKPVKVKSVGRELGVRYLLEGSVQKSGEKVRINAQLIDTTTANHLWAERYDRNLKDLFSVQDEIVQTIVTTLSVKIDEAERTRVMRKATDNLEAYEYYLRGVELLSRATRAANMNAKKMLEKAIERDPQYASAYVALGQCYSNAAAFGWTEFTDKALQQAHDLAKKALSIEESNSAAHRLLGSVYVRRMQDDLANIEYQRTIKLNPNDPRSRRGLASIMFYSGQTDDAIALYESALNFDPNASPGNFMNLGLAYYLKGRYDDAIRTLKRGVSRNPEFAGHYIGLAAAYAQTGRSQDAKRSAEMAKKLHPFFELDSYGSVFRK
jgi:adenylate cyclase